jgi:hypothetical protein
LAEVLPWRNLAGIFMAATAAAGPGMLLNARLALPTLVMLPLSGMAYVTTYSLLVWIFGLLDEEEKAALKRSLYIWRRSVAPVRPLPVLGKATQR